MAVAPTLVDSKLLDAFSGPLDRISRQLGKFESALADTVPQAKKLRQATPEMSGGKARQQTLGLLGYTARGTLIMRPATPSAKKDKVEELPRGPGIPWADMFSAAASTFVDVMKELGKVILRLSEAAIRWGLETAMFKEDATTSLKSITGSSAEAERIYAIISKLSLDKSQGTGIAKSLLGAGFDGGDLEELLLGLSDVRATFGDSAMASTLSALAKMKSTGKLTVETIEALGAAGIKTDLVYRSLARQLDVTEEQAKALVKAGTVKGSEGVTAIVDVIRSSLSNGVLGGASAAQADTLSGRLGALSSVPEELFGNLDTNRLLEPLKVLVSQLTSILGPDTVSGKRIIALMQTVGDTIGAVAARISTADMEATLSLVLRLIDVGVQMLVAFSAGFMDMMSDVVVPFVALLGKPSPKQYEDLAKVLNAIGGSVGLAIAAIVALGLALVVVAGVVVELYSYTLDAIEIAVLGTIAAVDNFYNSTVMILDFIVTVTKMWGYNFYNSILTTLDLVVAIATMWADNLYKSIVMTLDLIVAAATMWADNLRKTFDSLFGLITGDWSSGPNSGLLGQPFSFAQGGTANNSQVAVNVGDVHFAVDGSGGDGQTIAKNAASSFSAQLTSALRGIATEAGR